MASDGKLPKQRGGFLLPQEFLDSALTSAVSNAFSSLSDSAVRPGREPRSEELAKKSPGGNYDGVPDLETIGWLVGQVQHDLEGVG